MFLKSENLQETTRTLHNLASVGGQGDLHIYAPGSNGLRLKRITAHTILFQGGKRFKNIHQKFNIIPDVKEEVSVILPDFKAENVTEMIRLIYTGFIDLDAPKDRDQVCQLLKLFDFPISELVNYSEKPKTKTAKTTGAKSSGPLSEEKEHRQSWECKAVDCEEKFTTIASYKGHIIWHFKDMIWEQYNIKDGDRTCPRCREMFEKDVEKSLLEHIVFEHTKIWSKMSVGIKDATRHQTESVIANAKNRINALKKRTQSVIVPILPKKPKLVVNHKDPLESTFVEVNTQEETEVYDTNNNVPSEVKLEENSTVSEKKDKEETNSQPWIQSVDENIGNTTVVEEENEIPEPEIPQGQEVVKTENVQNQEVDKSPQNEEPRPQIPKGRRPMNSAERITGYVCEVEDCGKKSNTIQNYKIHIMYHYKDSVFKKYQLDEQIKDGATERYCPICEPRITFVNVRTILYHMVYTHTKLGDKVEKMRKKLGPISRPKTRNVGEGGVKTSPYAGHCKICDEDFSLLKRHLAISHFKEELFEHFQITDDKEKNCVVCKKDFDHLHVMILHLITAHRDKFSEDLADKFDQKDEAIEGAKKVTSKTGRTKPGAKPGRPTDDNNPGVKCHLCDNNYTNIKIHLINVHFKNEIMAVYNMDNRYETQCRLCDITVNSNFMLHHYAGVHRDKLPQEIRQHFDRIKGNVGQVAQVSNQIKEQVEVSDQIKEEAEVKAEP